MYCIEHGGWRFDTFLTTALIPNEVEIKWEIWYYFLMKDPWNILIMEKVQMQRFNGNYPAGKTISTEFANKGGADGLQIQIDVIA